MKLKDLTQEELDILVEKAKLYDKIAVLTKDSFGMINNTSETQKAHQEPKNDHSADIEEVISYLNKKVGADFNPKSKDTVQMLNARFKEKYTVADCKKVIDNMYEAWYSNIKMREFLRPSTLFRPTNFENYLNRSKVCSDNATSSWFDDYWDKIVKNGNNK